ncbi:MAG: ECF-type sigma factor [Planctomycetota bacterium]
MQIREIEKLDASDREEFDRLIEMIRAGDAGALDFLILRTYKRIRNIATLMVGGKLGTVSLDPSDLVSESFCRILKSKLETGIQDTQHYFSLFARNVRFVLLDYHKAKNSAKRGGQKVVCLDIVLAWAEQQNQSIEVLSDAISDLADEMPEEAAVLEYRYFGFMTEAEICEATDLTPWQVQKKLKFAKAYIRDWIEQ